MPNLLNIGVTALKANQSSLSTVSHNIANAATEGYSRQEVLRGTAPADGAGSNYFGNGVSVEGVRRIYDQFAVNEIRNHTSTVSGLDVFVEKAGRLDEVFGNAESGLSSTLTSFFSAVQTVAEDPASIPARQLMLSQGNAVSNRFASLQSQLETTNANLQSELEGLTTQVTLLAGNVAQLNSAIAGSANAQIGQKPNDLMDQRDEVLRKLAELVDIQAVESNDAQVTVFTSNGQALVIGGQSLRMTVGQSETDPTELSVFIQINNELTDISDHVVGGQIGGLLNFRGDIIKETQSQLGHIAVGLAHTFNEQHQLGMDLDNNLGLNFFTDLNSLDSATSRVFANRNNIQPANGVVGAYLTDIADLSTDEYRLSFPGTAATEYAVTNLRTGEEVASQAFSGTLPSFVEFDGLRIELSAGTFNAGDEFLIAPTQYAAKSFQVEVSDVRNIALAQPVNALGETSNRGTGVVTGVDMTSTNTSIFTTTPGQLSPPLSIEFTSSTTYDVLDVSNPLSPSQLVPPIRDQIFVPGITNTMLPSDNQQTGAVSSGPDAGSVVRNAVDGTYDNGYSAQTYVIVSTNPDTYAVDRQTFVSNANESAQSLADTLSLQTGVTATASNWAQIGSISSASPIVVSVNGVPLSGVDANSMADSINSSATLSGLGITARSDGSTITLEGSTGIDFEIDADGASATDSIVVTDRKGSTVTLVATGTAPANTPNATIGGQIEVAMDEGVELFTTIAGVFETNPSAVPLHLGFQLSLTGAPSSGDRFSINYNAGGTADNRNALALASIQSQGILNGGAQTLSQSNALLVESIGTSTAEAKINYEAATALLDQAKAIRDSVSGVNLDEEAAKLIEFEQGYNAAAQVINIARSLFDTLIGAVG